jgi:hypothetical protein
LDYVVDEAFCFVHVEGAGVVFVVEGPHAVDNSLDETMRFFLLTHILPLGIRLKLRNRLFR